MEQDEGDEARSGKGLLLFRNPRTPDRSRRIDQMTQRSHIEQIVQMTHKLRICVIFAFWSCWSIRVGSDHGRIEVSIGGSASTTRFTYIATTTPQGRPAAVEVEQDGTRVTRNTIARVGQHQIPAQITQMIFTYLHHLNV